MMMQRRQFQEAERHRAAEEASKTEEQKQKEREEAVRRSTWIPWLDQDSEIGSSSLHASHRGTSMDMDMDMDAVSTGDAGVEGLPLDEVAAMDLDAGTAPASAAARLLATPRPRS